MDPERTRRTLANQKGTCVIQALLEGRFRISRQVHPEKMLLSNCLKSFLIPLTLIGYENISEILGYVYALFISRFLSNFGRGIMICRCWIPFGGFSCHLKRSLRKEIPDPRIPPLKRPGKSRQIYPSLVREMTQTFKTSEGPHIHEMTIPPRLQFSKSLPFSIRLHLYIYSTILHGPLCLKLFGDETSQHKPSPKIPPPTKTGMMMNNQQST